MEKNKKIPRPAILPITEIARSLFRGHLRHFWSRFNATILSRERTAVAAVLSAFSIIHNTHVLRRTLRCGYISSYCFFFLHLYSSDHTTKTGWPFFISYYFFFFFRSLTSFFPLPARVPPSAQSIWRIYYHWPIPTRLIIISSALNLKDRFTSFGCFIHGQSALPCIRLLNIAALPRTTCGVQRFI